WVSGLAVGSSLGAVYWWYSTSVSDWGSAFFKKPFLSFSEWSMESDESTTDGSKTVFHKLALPDYSSKFIFGVSNLYLVFIRHLMDIVVIYSLLGLHACRFLSILPLFKPRKENCS
ncbi:hypothetical protein Gotri_001596, partial [Gossypium trilobum]|nr:hypothetical protein [Gossypium trilobum]